MTRFVILHCRQLHRLCQQHWELAEGGRETCKQWKGHQPSLLFSKSLGEYGLSKMLTCGFFFKAVSRILQGYNYFSLMKNLFPLIKKEQQVSPNEGVRFFSKMIITCSLRSQCRLYIHVDANVLLSVVRCWSGMCSPDTVVGP